MVSIESPTTVELRPLKAYSSDWQSQKITAPGSGILSCLSVSRVFRQFMLLFHSRNYTHGCLPGLFVPFRWRLLATQSSHHIHRLSSPQWLSRRCNILQNRSGIGQCTLGLQLGVLSVRLGRQP